MDNIERFSIQPPQQNKKDQKNSEVSQFILSFDRDRIWKFNLPKVTKIIFPNSLQKNTLSSWGQKLSLVYFYLISGEIITSFSRANVPLNAFIHCSASVFIRWHSAQFCQLLANLTLKSQCQKQKWTWIKRSRFAYVLILFPGLSKFVRCYMLKGKGLTASDVVRTPQVHRFLNPWIWLLFMPTTNFVFTIVTNFPFHKGKRHLEQEMWKELKRNPYACSVKVAHPSGRHTHFNSFALMW